MRVIRPFSTVRLTAVSSSPPMSIRAPGDPLSQTASPRSRRGAARADQEGGHPFRALDRTTGRGDHAAAVGDDDDVGREDVEQALQVAVADGGEEPVHGLLLLGRADRHSRAPSRDVVAGAVGDLADGGR